MEYVSRIEVYVSEKFIFSQRKNKRSGQDPERLWIPQRRKRSSVSSNMLRLFILIVATVAFSCSSSQLSKVESEKRSVEIVGNPRPTLSMSNTPSARSSFDLCKRLGELKKIPYEKNEVADDPVFDGLMKQGQRAIPCLIDRVIDTHVIEDPRDGDPHIHGFTVGDAAVFMLLNITDVQPEAMLPPEFAQHWNDQGIYSYFAYVEKRQNRKVLQNWWRNWAKKNLK